MLNTIGLASILFRIEEERRARGLGELVMLRNFEGLPESKPGNDIDLIVKSQELPAWDAALRAAARALDIDIALTMSDYYFCSFVFSHLGNEIIKIDLNHDLHWRGITFMEVEQILGNTVLYRTPIHICASGADRTFVTFCHSMLYGGFINSKYQHEFASQLRAGTAFRGHLERVFGAHHAQWLEEKILSGNLTMPRGVANKIRIAALVRSAGRTPGTTIHGFFRSLRGPISKAL